MKEKIRYILRNPLRIISWLITRLPYFRFVRETSDYQNQVGFDFWFNQKILNLGGNRSAYWPVHPNSKVYDAENIIVGIDAYPGIMPGCYLEGKGGITIGDYTQIAPNVVIVSSNHDLYDTRIEIQKRVNIGKYCWIGAGVKIMPGVSLGDYTVVGAGAVVTKSFTEGYCLIAGVPARLIRNLERGKCIPFQAKVLYNGYIKAEKFEAFRKKHLKL